MSDIQFGVRLTADGSAFVGGIQVSQKQIDQFAQAVAKANKDAKKSFEETAKATNVVAKAMEEIKAAIIGIATVGFVVETTKAFLEMSDAVSTLNARMREASSSVAELRESQSALHSMATRLQYSYMDLAKGFVEVSEAARDMGINQREAIAIAETLAAATRAEGQSSEQATQLMEQFSNVMTMGVEGGRAFVGILRTNHEYARLLADSLGVSTQQLRKMASDGLIPTTLLATKTAEMLDQMREKAAKMPPTIHGAWTEFKNLTEAVVDYTGWGKNLADHFQNLGSGFRILGSESATFWQKMEIGSRILLGTLPNVRELETRLQGMRRAVSGKITTASDDGKAAQDAFDAVIGQSGSAEGIRAKTKIAKDRIIAHYAELRMTTDDEIKKNTAAAMAALNKADADEKQQLEALAKQGAVSFGSIAGAIEKRLSLQQQAAQDEVKIQQDATQRKLDILEFEHTTGLTSDVNYYARRADAQREASNRNIEALRTEYTNTVAALEAMRSATAITADERTAKADKIAELQAKLTTLTIQYGIELNKAGDIERKVDESGIAARQKLITLQITLNREVQDFGRSLQKNIDEQEFQLAIANETDKRQAELTANRQVMLDLADKLLQKERELADATRRMAPQSELDAITASMQELVNTAGNLAPKIVNAAGATVVLKERTATLTEAWRQVDDIMWGFFDRMRSGWHSAMQYMKEQLVNILWRTLYQMTLQRFAMNIFANVTGAGVNAAGQALPGAAGSMGSSMFGGFASSALGSLGLGAGSFSTGVGMTMAAPFELGMNFSSIGALATGGELMTAIGMAAPYIAAAVAIGMLVKSFLDSKKGGPKVGGDYSSTGRGPFFPGEDTTEGNATAKGIVDASLKGFTDMASKWGLTSKAGMSFGFDTDPQGKAPNRLHSQVIVNGNVVYENAQGDLGRDSAALQAAMTTETKRMMLAALQNSDLPKAMAKVLNSVTALTATDAEIDNVIAFADAMHSVIDAISGSVVEDAQKAWDASQKSMIENLHDLGQTVIETAGKVDGSSQSMVNLANASTAFRTAAVQAALAIKQITVQLHEMFMSTRESVLTAGMSKQDKYDYDKKVGGQLMDELLASNDPARVKKLGEMINSYFTDAFNLLSPEEQVAHRQEFLDYLDNVDKAVTKKLSDLGTLVEGETVDPFAAAQKALDDAADKFQKAGTDQVKASNAMAGAVEEFGVAVDRFAQTRIQIDLQGGYSAAGN